MIEEIEKMTVLELNDLVKKIEEKFGVSAAAMAVAAPAAGGAAAPAAEEQTEFTVVLKEVGPNKIPVIKVVREITSLKKTFPTRKPRKSPTSSKKSAQPSNSNKLAFCNKIDNLKQKKLRTRGVFLCSKAPRQLYTVQNSATHIPPYRTAQPTPPSFRAPHSGAAITTHTERQSQTPIIPSLPRNPGEPPQGSAAITTIQNGKAKLPSFRACRGIRANRRRAVRQ